MAQPKPVLDLSTLTEKPIVAIDGVGYDLNTPDDLTVIGYKKLTILVPRMTELYAQVYSAASQEPDADPAVETATEAALAKVLDDLCRLILIAPDEVHRRLTDLQRFQVYQVFTERPAPRIGATLRDLARAATTATRSGKTGAVSPRGSVGSMPARRRSNGSKSSRSATSRRA